MYGDTYLVSETYYLRRKETQDFIRTVDYVQLPFTNTIIGMMIAAKTNSPNRTHSCTQMMRETLHLVTLYIDSLSIDTNYTHFDLGDTSEALSLYATVEYGLAP